MAFLPIVTVGSEGGLYSPDRNPNAPIRIYPDRSVVDVFLLNATGVVKRKRLTRKEFNNARKYAVANRRQGLV